jgi:hypothetical protein
MDNPTSVAVALNSATVTLQQFLAAKERRLQEDRLFLQQEKLRIKEENQRRVEERLREEDARRQARLDLVSEPPYPSPSKGNPWTF